MKALPLPSWGGPRFPSRRTARPGPDHRGRTYREEWGWLGGPANPHRRYVRRITLERAGEEPVLVVTSLLDAAEYPASDLLELYALRWGIERVFQQVTEVFGLAKLIGGTPQATVFPFAFCLLLYNMTHVIPGTILNLTRCSSGGAPNFGTPI